MPNRIDDFVRRVKNPFWVNTSRANEIFEGFSFEDVCPPERWENIPHLRFRVGPVETLESGPGSRLAGPALAGAPDGYELAAHLDLAELADVHRGEVPLPSEGTLTLFTDVVETRVQLRRDLTATGAPARGRRLIPELVERVDRRAEREAEVHGRCVNRMFWGQSPQTGTWLYWAAMFELKRHGLGGSLKELREAEAKGVDVVEIIRGLTSWRMLWQIDGDDEIGLTAGGEDRLYVFIRLDDLEAGRFDRVVPVVEPHS
ncbi:MAG: DUF1963 domain-containing protein [Labilithrix sp.]|nr:DUF1963 domain-containing protein [Labilithrix sp.]MCW5809790.1 DUF1963 domain-containing protein [Labilithrix sp.]